MNWLRQFILKRKKGREVDAFKRGFEWAMVARHLEGFSIERIENYIYSLDEKGAFEMGAERALDILRQKEEGL